MEAVPLLVTRENDVLRLTINRPDAANTLDVALSKALFHAAIECDEDETVRAVLLTGNGKLFCGGGDITGFAAAGDSVSHLAKELTTYLNGAVSRLARMDKPLVVAVNGPAAGAGLSLAMLGDIVIAEPEAHFSAAYSAIGLTPDLGQSWLLPRLVGLRRAQELMLTNRRVGAREAAEIGLITRVAAGDALAEASALAVELASGPRSAIAGIRALLARSFTTGLEEQLELEARAIAKALRGMEGQEGISAFLSKRKADFRCP
ncbi:enoyl-CoA hydratase/isomerase family protein [Acidocella sp.]|uniref:enoyl-CoA hydratase/isomerase family protein n=1 Tax=Acidocella sp. TaxID=50710 RepID=UPI003D0880B2